MCFNIDSRIYSSYSFASSSSIPNSDDDDDDDDDDDVNSLTK